MTYRANPVTVEAHSIASVGVPRADGSLPLVLDNGARVSASSEMRARMMPTEGDYWVTQQDGYVYLNPKDVFERKYSRVEPRPSKEEFERRYARPEPPTFSRAVCRGSYMLGSACGQCERCDWERARILELR